MRRPLPAPPELQRPFTYACGIASGQGNGRLRGPAYSRLGRGLVVPAGLELDHRERACGWLQVLPDGSVLGGMSAAAALGVPWVDPGEDVEVVLARNRVARQRSGLAVRRDVLRPEEVTGTPWGPATTGARTAFDLGRRLQAVASSRSTAGVVARVDAVLRATGTSVEQVRQVASVHGRARGITNLAALLELVDPLAESPPESVVRVMIVLAGLPVPKPQHEVRLPSGRTARLDLAWPELKVALEYDGKHHRDPWQHSQDLLRHNALRELGWVVVQVDAAQLRQSERLLTQLRSLLTP